MSDNTIRTPDNIEVYENSIKFFADEYINDLYNPDEIYKPHNNMFTGMIKYISKQIKFDRSILADINILNDIWESYTDLVYKYNQKPTIEEYCILINISRETMYTWLNGEYRNTDICEKLGTTRSDTIKKWQEECRLGRYKGAATGNVGMIFLCKAVDGMVETAPVQVPNNKAALSVAELPRLGTPKLSESQTQLPDADNT